jgi:hypothetical protein
MVVVEDITELLAEVVEDITKVVPCWCRYLQRW